jgi:hypothetical protein
MVYTCMSVLLASAPMLPVYAGKQSTPSTSSGSTPTTGGQTPSTNNPGQGGTQNTPNTPNTNTNTATPPQVVNELAQQSMSTGAMVGIGAAGLAGVGLLGAGIYGRKAIHDFATVAWSGEKGSLRALDKIDTNTGRVEYLHKKAKAIREVKTAQSHIE